jgi:hypothetical protein
MNRVSKSESGPTTAPEPANSFENEFLNARGVEISQAMSRLGFIFKSSREEDGRIIYEGQRSNGDGTLMVIRIYRGEQYKSPMELASEEEGK